MRACIHRGSQQIGGSCVEVEHEGNRLLLDLGLPLDAPANTPAALPAGLALPGDCGESGLLGILISHPHLDHYGLLAHVPPAIPVGMGAAARRILQAAAPFLPGQPPLPAPGWDYQSGQPLHIGPFTVTPYLVDHSAYDAYALLIEAGGERLFYSGDFRAHGRKAQLFERMVDRPPKHIDALLLEGSSLGRLADDAQFPSESEIEAQLVKEFNATPGMALVHTSGQNIDRVVSVFRACRRTQRRLVIDLYAAAILQATANPRLPQSHWQDVALFVPHSQRVKIKKESWFEQLQAHAAHRIYPEQLAGLAGELTLLFRPLHQRDLADAGCLAGARYIYSQWEGYWEQGSYDDVREWLDQHGIARVPLHTSGHASPVDLRRFVQALAPGKVVPIHSFRADRYPKLFPRVEPHADGQWWPVKGAA